MPVKTKPVEYTTSDGREFAKEAEANRYEEMLTALRNFEESRKKFLSRLAETQLTADGHQFDFSGEYYAIYQCYGGELPLLESIYLYWYPIQMAQSKTGIVEICPDPDNEHKRNRKYRISDLYKLKKNAERALIVAQKERVSHYQNQIAETEAKL